MTQIEFKTNVKIDHEFYKLSLIDYTGHEFTYAGKFTETPEAINQIINSDICLSAEKVTGISNEVMFRFEHKRTSSKQTLQVVG